MLKLKEWARRLFSVILLLAIVVNLSSFFAFIFSFIRKTGLFDLPEGAVMAQTALNVQLVFQVLYFVVTLVIVWIFIKLNTQKIKTVFKSSK